MVGDGTISASRGGGSFRDSVFQIPVPQGKEGFPTWFQGMELPIPGLVFGHPDWSVAGLLGLEAPVDKGPLVVNDAFLVAVAGISFSHDVRRAGLGAGMLVDVATCCEWSPSSSEDAKASESGVDRRTPGWVFSSLADTLLVGVDEVTGLAACAVDLPGGAAMML